MPEQQRSIPMHWHRQLIPMNGCQSFFLPYQSRRDAEMAKLFSERPVVIAKHGNQFGGSGEFLEQVFNPGAFRAARTRRMDQISQEDEALRV